MDDFITIKENIESELIVKKSKFICNLIKVESQKEADEIIKNLKKKYYDARHNCIAFRVMENEKIAERASDDGEPSGTAGAPMLNILQKNNLCNILAVVTRYFGGILLGTGGLVKAYSDVTLSAIENAEKFYKCVGIEARAIVEYNYLDVFKYYCKKNNINIVKMEYSEKIICNIELEEIKKVKLLEDFEKKNIKLIDLQFLSKKLIEKSILK